MKGGRVKRGETVRRKEGKERGKAGGGSQAPMNHSLPRVIRLLCAALFFVAAERIVHDKSLIVGLLSLRGGPNPRPRPPFSPLDGPCLGVCCRATPHGRRKHGWKINLHRSSPVEVQACVGGTLASVRGLARPVRLTFVFIFQPHLCFTAALTSL